MTWTSTVGAAIGYSHQSLKGYSITSPTFAVRAFESWDMIRICTLACSMCHHNISLCSPMCDACSLGT